MKKIINSPSNCRSCGGWIYWMQAKNGKRIPVDYDSKFMTHSEFNPDLGHVAHFATCPNANEHSRNQRTRLWK